MTPKCVSGVVMICVSSAYLVYASAIILCMYSKIVFFVVSVGYLVYSGALHVVFYRDQPSPSRAVDHIPLVAFNLWLAATYAMTTTELHIRGYSSMQFGPLPHIVEILVEVIMAIGLANTVEYYWHCLLHSRYFYVRFHKVHHYYKKPQPFDDMYMHPFEGAVYYCILYGPPFIFSMHVISYVAYMIVMGFFGVLDHSGIPFHIPLVYNSEDHARHHSLVQVNYGFPFPYLDLFHGTFEGTFAGVNFRKRANKSI